MSSAELNEQCVNGANLNTVPTTSTSNLRSINVVLTIRFDERKRVNRSTMLSRALGPAKPYSNSWSTRPVLNT
jgi:hypothetical protein